MSNITNALKDIGGSITGLGAVIDLFGGKSQAELDAIDKQNRNVFIKEQINVYGLGTKQQYINPDVINDLMYGQGIWQSKTQRYLNAVEVALGINNAQWDTQNSDYKNEALSYVAKIDQQIKNSVNTYGLNTDDQTGKTTISYGSSALRNTNIAGFPSWLIIALILGVGVTYYYSKK